MYKVTKKINYNQNISSVFRIIKIPIKFFINLIFFLIKIIKSKILITKILINLKKLKVTPN